MKLSANIEILKLKIEKHALYDNLKGCSTQWDYIKTISFRSYDDVSYEITNSHRTFPAWWQIRKIVECTYIQSTSIYFKKWQIRIHLSACTSASDTSISACICMRGNRVILTISNKERFDITKDEIWKRNGCAFQTENDKTIMTVKFALPLSSVYFPIQYTLPGQIT